MGEVYRAKDTRLDRTVAIKVLPAQISDRADLRQRLEREARAVSSLNHPHICALYDIGHQDGIDYLVMEYLEGETLAQRLMKGALPLDQVLRYAIEIADALDQAHRHGVIHRDLKPGNIMLTRSGAKLLDFGLAKRKVEAASGRLGPSAETALLLSSRSGSLTEGGTICGTLQYMAPEQLEGKDADARTDIFAFGAVLHEMATGRKAFEGKSQASLIAAILEHDPAAISTLQPLTPPALDRVVKKCLAKDPEERWQTAHDLKDELKWIAELGPQSGGAATTSTGGKSRKRLASWAWITSVVLFVIALALAIAYFRLPLTEGKTTFLSLPLPEKTTVKLFSVRTGSAISPDGRRLALVAFSEGQARLWLYSFDSPAPRLLPGTDGASYPFWSPDSQAIGFFAQGKLKRIEVSGGPPSTLCDAPLNARGGAWNLDGVILFGPAFGPLRRVPQTGGAAVPVTTLDESHQEIAHHFPHFLPDGRHFVYLALSAGRENRGICIGTLDGTTTKRLLRADSSAVYAQPGYLLFVREQKLLAQPFNQQHLATTGDPLPVVDKVAFNPFGEYAEMSVSDSGTLVYRSVSSTDSELVWFDRAGRAQTVVGPRAGYMHIDLSPDGRQVVMDRIDPQKGEVDAWLLDLKRDIPTRLTTGKVGTFCSLWSPDGARIVFVSGSGDGYNLYRKRTTGNDQEELLLKGGEYMNPTDWSKDGRFIIYSQWGLGTQQGDLWVLPLDGERQPRKYIATPFDEYWGRLSPDGRWMAYVSNETGSDEVYVQSFPEPGRRERVSSGGGSHPRWRGDGRELFYLAPDKRLMAVAVKGENTFESGAPAALFETPGFDLHNAQFPYAATADGQRFLVIRPVENASAKSLTVVLNWAAGLRR
jgi:serine/threonine protein kinase